MNWQKTFLEPVVSEKLVATSDWKAAAALSQAVSLKRIADALDRLGGPLNAYGETIGECIQGQHERGLRGIPNP